MAHDFPLFSDPSSQPHGPQGPSRADVLSAVEARLITTFGEPSGRAGVTFLGAETIEVLRFGPDADGLVRYATLGMARPRWPTPPPPSWTPCAGRASSCC